MKKHLCGAMILLSLGKSSLGHQAEPPLCHCSAIHQSWCDQPCLRSPLWLAGAEDPQGDEPHSVTHPRTVAIWETCADSASQPSVGICYFML